MLQNLFLHLHSVCSSVYKCALFKAAFALTFFGALRVGELVSPSKGEKGGLLVQDVECLEGAVGVWVRRSKTDQGGKGMRLQMFSVPGA